MSEHRAHMMAALKSSFAPALRERGFIGAFPHFRGPLLERVDWRNCPRLPGEDSEEGGEATAGMW
jgi:hypothetical protein